MWQSQFWSIFNKIRNIKWGLFVLISLIGVSAGSVFQVTAENITPANNRTSVVAAPNGVPLVDIARPNAQGLSHNLFREFSVGTQGAILNNSRQEAARSVLGGIVPGNPNLRDGAASVILNEVTGVSRSQLNGYLEVHGQRADVIVANPNGITCNGCGFINTPRATLTTGIPELDGNGNLTGFRVENGDVTFGALGANFSDIDIVDVLSRKIYINGRIDAKTLRLIAGHNRVNYNDVENPTELSASTSNEIVIDSSLLGGMYVERLSIVANNKGTGVHMRGDMASSVGDISLRADGSITVGRVSSGRKLTIRSANKTVKGARLSSKGALGVTAKEAIYFDAISSDATIDITSEGDSVTISQASALGNITISGLNDLMLDLVESEQNVTLVSHAGNIDITDESYSGGNSIIAAKQNITAPKIFSDQSALVVAEGGLFINQLQALDDVTLNILGAVTGTGVNDFIEAGNNLTIEAASIDVTRLYAGNITDITVDGAANVSELIGVNALVALAGSLQLGDALSNGAISLTATNQLTANLVQSDQSLTFTAGSMDVLTAYAGTTLTATTTTGDLAIKDAQSLGDLTLTASNGAIKLNQALSEENIRLQAKTSISAIDQPGLIEADGNLTIVDASSVNIDRLYGGNVTDITARGNVTVEDLIGVNGLITSGQNLFLKDALSNGAISLTATNQLIANLVQSDESIMITAGSLDIMTAYAGTILTATTTTGDLSIKDAQSVGDLTLTSNNGAIKLNQALSAGNIRLQAKTSISAIDQPGLIEADGNLTIVDATSVNINRLFGGNITNITARGDITVAELIGENGLIASGQNLLLGYAFSDGDIVLTATNQLTADRVDNDLSDLDHLVDGNQSITLTAASINIGIGYSDGFFEATAKTGNLNINNVFADEALTLISEQGAVTGDVFSAADNLLIDGETGITATKIIETLGALTLTATSGDILTKNIQSVGKATITARNLIVTKEAGDTNDKTGHVVSLDGIDITTTERVDVEGDIIANTNDVKITAGTSIDYGNLSAGRDVILSSGTSEFGFENGVAVGRNLQILTTADILNWSGQNIALTVTGDIEIIATNADLSGGNFSFGNVIFSITNDLNLSNASLRSDTENNADITISARSLTHTSSSELVAGGNLYLTLSQSFTNRMMIGSFGDTVMKVAGDLTNMGDDNNDNAGLIGAFNNLGLFVTGTITNINDGTLWVANGDLVIAGSDTGITHLAGGGFLLPGDLNSLVKNVKVLNSSGVIEAGRDIIIATGNFENKRTAFATRFTSAGGEKIDGYNHNFQEPNNENNSKLLSRCSWCPTMRAPRRAHGSLTYDGYVFVPLIDTTNFDYDRDPVLETDWVLIKAEYEEDNDQEQYHTDNLGGIAWGRLRATGREIDTTNSTAESRLSAGRNLIIISTNDITNNYSLIEAGLNITMSGRNLNNTGESFSQSRTIDFLYADGYVNWRDIYHDETKLTFYGAGAADLNSQAPVIVYNVGGLPHYTLSQGSEDGGISGRVEAGGTFTGTFDNAIDNANIAEGVTPNNDNLDRSFGGEKTLTLLAPLQNQPFDLTSSEKHLDTLSTISTLSGGRALFTGPQQVVEGSPDTSSSSSSTNRNVTGRNEDLHQTAGEQTFLFETRPPFIDINKFYGSAYFMDRIGYEHDTQVKFLGDAFFETRLIEQAILNKTGRRLLDSNYQNASGQLKALIDNGADTQKDLELTVGTALTRDQINKLTKDIVWYVERVVNGEKVLVPEIYLSHRTTFDFANDGAIIQGKSVNLTARNDINNRGGRISSGQDLSLRSTEGTINLAAVSKSYDFGEGRKREILGRRAKFTAGGTLTLLADKDINIEGSTVSSGEDLILGAGNNVNIKSHTLTNQALKFGRKGYRQEVWRKDQVLSDLTSGGDTTILAESGNLAIEGATVRADGRADLAAGKEVSIAAVEEKQGYDIKWKRGFKKQDTRTLRENSVAAGKDLTITSGDDTSVKASEIIAGGKQEGDLSIVAGGKAKIQSDEETFDSDQYSKKKGFLKKRERRETIHDERTVSSRIGASGDVNIIAEDDVDIKASQLDAGKDLRIAAGTKLNDNNELTASGKDANVNITTNREDDSYYKYEKSSGLMGSSSQGSFFFGYKKEKHIIDTKTATHALASLSAGQSVIVTATKDIDADAPLIAANDNIELTAGRDVNIKSVQDLFDHHEYHKTSQFGVTVSVFENVSSSFKALTDFNTGKGSGGAKAISTISAGLRAIDAVNTLTGGHLAGVNIGIGFSSSKSTLDQTYKTAKTGVLQAGQDVKIEAGRDINTEGTAILAGRDVELDAGRDLNLKAAESTTEEKPSSKSSSLGASVTVGVGLKGVGISAGVNGSVSKSNSEGESKSYTNTKIVAGNEAKLKSGRDTVLEGARVEADRIIATVGRDLTIKSLQNTSKFKSSSKGASFGLSTNLGGYSTGIDITPDNILNNALGNKDAVSIFDLSKAGPTPGGGSSWNLGLNGSKGKGEFAWVQEQSGLVAENEVDVTVGGNTDLKAGIIASKSKDLSLDTGTLTFSDLADKDKSKNIGGGISIGGPLSGGGDKSAGKTNSGDLNFTIEGQYAKKDKEGVTRATVGEGEIKIRDTEKQKELEESGKTQKLANLNRDLDKAQEVTKDEETEINLYVSSSSLKTLKKIGEAAVNAIDNLVNEGKLSAESGERVNGILEKLEEIDQESLRICLSGGSSSGWLHDIFFTPVYAAGDGCVVRFLGAERLYNKDGTRISEEEHAQLRQVLALQAKEKIKDIIHNIEIHKKLFPDDYALVKLNRDLETNLGYFALCADDDHWQNFVSNTPFLQNDAYKRSLEVAQTYRQSIDSFVEKHGSFANKDAEAVAQLRNKNLALFNALAKKDYSQIDESIVDGTLLLLGANNNKNLTPEEKQNAIKVAARGIAVARNKWVEAAVTGGGKDGINWTDSDLRDLANFNYIQTEIQNNLSSEDQEFFKSQLTDEIDHAYKSTGGQSVLGKTIKAVSSRIKPYLDPDTNKAKVIHITKYNPGTGKEEAIPVQLHIDLDTGEPVLYRNDGLPFIPGDQFQLVVEATAIADLTKLGFVGIKAGATILSKSSSKGGIDYFTIPKGYRVDDAGSLSAGKDPTKNLPDGYIRVVENRTNVKSISGPNGLVDNTSNWLPDHFPDIKGFSLDARLPIRPKDSGATHAVADVNGKELFFKSQKEGPGKRWYKEGIQANFQSATHVENHAAGYMIDNNIKVMTITINNIKGPCRRCLTDVPKRLPEGSVLYVKWKDFDGDFIITPIVGTRR